MANLNKLGLNERQQVFCVVLFYMITALVMVSVNKWALNTLQLPWLLLWCQMAIAVLLLKVTDYAGFLKMPIIQKDVAKALIPLIAINVLGLGVNTLCLVYVDTSFYQIARGLVLPFTVIFAYTLLGQSSSKLVLGSCFVVFCGFYTGVTSEIDKSLGAVNNSSIDLVYYNNALSLLATTPILFLSSEYSEVMVLLNEQGFAAFHGFLFAAFVTGIFGFLINLAGFLQISKTSPTTHMVSGAVRGVLQTLLGYYAFNDIITSGRLIGIILILGGGALYTYAKDQEMKANTKPTYIPMTQQDADDDGGDRNKVGRA
ncbi:hypothetical protein BGZ97_012873 [Linnemannia gamsii]|uniref:Sugar phosphate transporter domain-containing protein n=1 Tax=Linnemannia gamsii TaxID=64522 RepID=A0A9P6RPG5_9FUNG|nr:hypothetical protein BGZ97_012873 [Linnemannia gamsii]